MAADVNKHLDRAKRFLEKTRVEEAIQAYLSVLDEAPQHQEATQALGDLYARMEQPDRAAVYYGLLFDLLLSRAMKSKHWRSTIVSCDLPQVSNRRNASRVTPSCSKSRIASTKPSSNTAKPPKCLTRPAAPRMRCFVG